MKFNDAIIAVLLLVLAVALFLGARTLPSLPGQSVGPALFPMTIAVALVLTSVAILLNAVSSGRMEPWVVLNDGLFSPRTLASVFAVPASVIAYMAFADVVGFLAVSSGILFGLMMVFRTKVGVAASVSVLVSTGCFLLFRSVLMVPLPEGAVERLLMEVFHAV
ncbi:tripartite tricarboxylate transporter TctB family protein [Azospirillum brasilense]|uniref:Tripartite tricarboxylate transporter TctB family protein n=1 Tax=Azospirillum brasilense TaxID=192 RepID=A0A6L3AUP3_AZOBR|nr:tripartite tricarboxylate transporter TctB family protein [Azospirillum brasilense]KAA0677580.1 tripartite tricarboxylate transporter TctB family protein [Azospirillum brasilense]